MPAGALLLFDRGYTDFQRFLALTQAQITWITRAKSRLAFHLERPLIDTARIQDGLGWIGEGATRQQVRLVSVLVSGQWYRYLTNELDPQRLPAPELVALYRHRWNIEEAYATVKRLLGLAFFWVGSENGVQLQLWATWLLYAVLVDLSARSPDGQSSYQTNQSECTMVHCVPPQAVPHLHHLPLRISADQSRSASG